MFLLGELMKQINSFDIDGVIFMGDYDGIYPGPNDVIITGRSIEEFKETEQMLKRKGITNSVYYNPLPFDQKSRESSGKHKGETIARLRAEGINIACHFEDDPIQIKEIRKILPDIHIIEVKHELVTKENVRHYAE